MNIMMKKKKKILENIISDMSINRELIQNIIMLFKLFLQKLWIVNFACIFLPLSLEDTFMVTPTTISIFFNAIITIFTYKDVHI